MATNLIIDVDKDTTFKDTIRRLLGGVDEDVLSDEDILDSSIFDFAELQLFEYVPCIVDEGALTETEKIKVRLAMIYMLASLLINVVKGRVEYDVKTIDVSWKKSPIKYNEMLDDFNDKINSLLSGISCFSNSLPGVFFAIAPSKRSVEENK